jgi:hypothetical protein
MFHTLVGLLPTLQIDADGVREWGGGGGKHGSNGSRRRKGRGNASRRVARRVAWRVARLAARPAAGG